MIHLDTTIVIGVLGAGIVLVFFVLNQLNRIKNNAVLYDVGNFVGSSLLVVYSILLSSIPFAVLNGVWALFSLRDIFLDISRREKDARQR